MWLLMIRLGIPGVHICGGVRGGEWVRRWVSSLGGGGVRFWCWGGEGTGGERGVRV